MNKPKRGRPPKFLHKIMALKRGTQVYFAGASHDSVKAIASHAGKVSGRRHTTRAEDDGVIVWRET